MGELCVAEAARSFAAEHPRMRVDLHLSDGLTDMAAGGFDMAVRIGIPRDSSLLMQRIGATTPRIAASPAYLAAHGTPSHPRDLAGHVAALDLNEQQPGRWDFQDAGQQITVTMQGQIAVNSAAINIRQALEGAGLVRAPDIFLAPHLARGTLRTVLDDFANEARPIHILSQRTAFRQRKIAAFGAVLRRHLDQLVPAAHP